MKTDTLTLKIYDKIVEFYKQQILLNIDLITDYESEKKLHKLPYNDDDTVKIITVDSFTCKFKDAFDIKMRYDKLLQPRERYYHFKQPAVKPVEITVPKPSKPKRTYTKRVKAPIAKLPKISIFKTILLYLKAS